MLSFTLPELRLYNPCTSGYNTLINALHSDFQSEAVEKNHQIPLEFVFLTNGIRDAAWCLRMFDESKTRIFVQDVLNLLADESNQDIINQYNEFMETNDYEILGRIRDYASAGIAFENDTKKLAFYNCLFSVAYRNHNIVANLVLSHALMYNPNIKPAVINNFTKLCKG
ncbi:MAG: hypothetical protein ACRC3J_05080 [Culicoidibacterales bacterium]